METKSKSEKLIFWGFIILTLCFFGLVYYFQYQNSLLTEKEIMFTEKEKQFKFEKIKYENVVIERDQVIELVPLNLKKKVDLIGIETKKVIKEDINKLASENSIIYIQVENNETKLKLKNQNFISILNSNGYKVIGSYDIEENGVDNTIRYFNEVDKILSEKLKYDIKKNFPEIVLQTKYVKSYKVPVGQIEIWIK